VGQSLSRKTKVKGGTRALIPRHHDARSSGRKKRLKSYFHLGGEVWVDLLRRRRE